MSRICILLLVCCGVVSPGWREASLNQSSEPLLKLKLAGPIIKKKIPLTHALAQLGWHTQGGYVLFGVEVRLIGGREPAVNLDLPAGTALGAALRQVFQQLPRYRAKVVSQHLVDVYPAGATSDPNDALNLRINRFDVIGEPPDEVANYFPVYVPELAQRLAQRKVGPSPPMEPPFVMMFSVGPKVTLHLHDLTVREILNSVAEASEQLPAKYLPGGWVATLRPDPALATGWSYSFRWYPTTSSNWKQRPEQ